MFVLDLVVIPRASCNKFILEESGLKLKITDSPVNGAANAKVILLLAKEFSCLKKDISLLSGRTSRKKRLLFHSISQEEGDCLLQDLLKRS